MTYRKLFIGFTIGSALAVAALWYWSCQARAEVRVKQGTRYGYYRAGIWSGTLILQLDSPEARPTLDEADAIPLPMHFSLPSLDPGRWQFLWTWGSSLSSRFQKYRRTGEFDAEKRLTYVVMGPNMIHRRATYRLDVPLWVPWLLMVGAAFAVTRWVERRSEGWKEKKLAEENAVDRLQGDPS